MSFNANTLNYNSCKAELSLTLAVATPIAVAGTYVKLLGTTASSTLNKFTMPANNRLTCTNTTPNKFYKVNVSFTGSTTANNNTMGICIALNGVIIPATIMENREASSGTPINISTTDIVQLSNTDFIECWTTNVTATNNITASRLIINITEIV
jgi:hypothetical protein